MTIRYEAHRTVEFAIGVVVGGLPLLLVASSTVTISAAAVLFCGFAGALLTLQGISGTQAGQQLDPRAHAFADRLLVVMLLGAAIVLGVNDEALVSLLCAASGIVLAAMSTFTRFSSLPSDQDPAGPPRSAEPPSR